MVMMVYANGATSLFPKCFGDDLERVVHSRMCEPLYYSKPVSEVFNGDSSSLGNLNLLEEFKTQFSTLKLRRCDNKICGNKETIEKHFKFCTRCKIPRYCSIVCQKIHWANGHKQACFVRNKQ